MATNPELGGGLGAIVANLTLDVRGQLPSPAGKLGSIPPAAPNRAL